MTDATEERSKIDGDEEDCFVKRRGMRQTEERTGAVKLPCNERCTASLT